MTKTKEIRAPEIPMGECGDWLVERFEVTPKDAEFHNLRERIQVIQGNGRGGREIQPGAYTRLIRVVRKVVSRTVVMSDTPAEIRDHARFIRRAHGRVLISGLGLGIITRAVLDKPGVDHVTVLEKSTDVCQLVSGAFQPDVAAGRLEIIVADVFKWKPPQWARWDCVWHDIWNDICADNLPEMKRLRRKFCRRTPWQGFWCEMEHLRAARR